MMRFGKRSFQRSRRLRLIRNTSDERQANDGADAISICAQETGKQDEKLAVADAISEKKDPEHSRPNFVYATASEK